MHVAQMVALHQFNEEAMPFLLEQHTIRVVADSLLVSCCCDDSVTSLTLAVACPNQPAKHDTEIKTIITALKKQKRVAWRQFKSMATRRDSREMRLGLHDLCNHA
eukprot:6413283-Amphidinium_carterae.2